MYLEPVLAMKCTSKYEKSFLSTCKSGNNTNFFTFGIEWVFWIKYASKWKCKGLNKCFNFYKWSNEFNSFHFQLFHFWIFFQISRNPQLSSPLWIRYHRSDSLRILMTECNTIRVQTKINSLMSWLLRWIGSFIRSNYGNTELLTRRFQFFCTVLLPIKHLFSTSFAFRKTSSLGAYGQHKFRFHVCYISRFKMRIFCQKSRCSFLFSLCKSWAKKTTFLPGISSGMGSDSGIHEGRSRST